MHWQFMVAFGGIAVLGAAIAVPAQDRVGRYPTIALTAVVLGLLAAPFLGCASSRMAGESLEAMLQVLKDPNQTTQAKEDICTKLMDMGPGARKAVPALIDLLADKDVLMRDYVVSTLKAIGPAAETSLPALRRIIASDPSDEVRQMATEAIRAISASPSTEWAVKGNLSSESP